MNESCKQRFSRCCVKPKAAEIVKNSETRCVTETYDLLTTNSENGMNYVKRFLRGPWLRKAASYVSNPAKMKWLLQEASHYCGRKGLDAVRSEFAMLSAMVRDVASGTYTGYAKSNFLLAVAAIIYVVSPIDIVPDFLVGLGLLDDVAIVGWAMSKLGEEVDKYQAFAAKKGEADADAEQAMPAAE